MEALQSVTIFALAALVMAGVYWIWDQAKVGEGNGLKGAIEGAVKGVFKGGFGGTVTATK